MSNILIVDDEQLIRWSLKESLSRAGFHVLEAEDASSALAAFRRSATDIAIVLLDLRLPDADGLAVIEQIKFLCPNCMVILMTAYGTAETAEEATRRGAHLMINKPFNVDDMVSLVGQALGGATD